MDTDELEDIAAFLVLIFQKYFESSSNSLESFLIFLNDVNLLSNRLSIIDANRLLTDSCNVETILDEEKQDNLCISYERFYHCLRKVAMKTYREGDMVNAFRLLLSKNIIPMARGLEPKSNAILKSLLYLVNEKNVNIISDFERFFLAWYIHMCLEGVHILYNILE